MADRLFAQGSDFEQSADAIVVNAQNGDKEARQYLFFLAALENQGAAYPLKAAEENISEPFSVFDYGMFNHTGR